MLSLEFIVVLLRDFDVSLLDAVGFPVECKEEEEVLDSSEGKHQRGGYWVVTAEDQRLEVNSKD